MLALSRYAAAERHTKEVVSGKAKRVARREGSDGGWFTSPTVCGGVTCRDGCCKMKSGLPQGNQTVNLECESC